MPQYSCTEYFEKVVLPRRPYLRREWCIAVLKTHVRCERQQDNRWRFRAPVPDLNGRYLRVITLSDRTTIRNAFPDRRFSE